MKLNRYTYLLTLLISACPLARIQAQGVCSSSALAPVYSQTFGTSTSSSKKSTVPSGFVTNYTFNGSSALSDGQYIVTPLVQNSQRNDWAMGGDHTGDSNGNLYLVNAGKPSSGPVDLFFSKQVDNLCPGSVYSFSAWLANVNTISNTKSICGSGLVYPKVTFNIKNTSGTILQSFTTDTLPLTVNRSVAPNWKQYGFQFTLPTGTTSLILEMRDALGGQASYCGNDFAVDDIVFSACTPTATITLNSASTICSGTSTSITSSIVNSPYSNPAYQWQKSTDGGTTWTNTGTPGTTATNYTISSAATTDAGMYRVVVGPDVSSLSSSTCITASNSITLAVNPSPSATVTAASTICSGNTLSFTGTSTGGTTPYTYSWSGPNGFTATILSPSISNISIAGTGTYTLTVTDSKSCTATASASVTVGSTPPSVAAISGGSGGCAGTTLALSDATSGGVWSSSDATVATVNSSGLVSLTGPGTATISYTVSNGSCSVAATKTITTASVQLHPDVIECNNGITHFTATDAYYGVTYSNSNAGNTYAWSITGGSYSYQGSSSASSQYPNLQLLTGSTFQVIVQFTTGGATCSDTQMVYKNTTAADTIQGSKDTTVCFNTSPIALSGKVSPVTNVYSWTTTGTGTFSAPNSLSTTYTPSAADKAAGKISIYLSGSSTLNSTGNCGSATAIDSMILRIYPDNVGTNSTQTICSNQTLNFTPVAAITGSTFSWISSVTSGSVTGNSPSGTGNIIDSLVNLSATNTGVVKYTITPYAFTPSNISCSGTPFTYIVTINPRPATTITNNTANLCTGSSTQITFSSSLGGSTYTWTSKVVSGTVSGNSSSNTASATNTINDVLVNNSSSNAWVRYFINTISPAGCTSTDSTDVLVYGASSTSNAGTDQVLCNVTNTLLAASNPALGNGSWIQVSGPSTVSFGAVTAANSTVTNLVPGVYLLAWQVVNGTCAANTDTVMITNAAPSNGGTLSANATVCSGANSGTLNLSGYTGSVIRWESSADNGATWANIPNTASSYTYNNLTATTVFRAVVQSGNCSTANSNTVTISIDAATVPGTVHTDSLVCAASNSGILSLSGFTGTILKWESSTDNGISWNTIANTTANYAYSNLAQKTLFRAAVQNGNCGAANTNAVTIDVTPQTVAGTLASSVSVCAVANSGSLSLTGYTGNILNWQSSADNGTSWNNITNTTNLVNFSNLTATTLFRAAVQSGVCPAIYSNNVTVTVLQSVSTANAGPDQQLCNVSSASLAATIPSSGTGSWSALAGNPSTVTFTNPSANNTTVNGLTTGDYFFVWTVSNGLCADSKDTVKVSIDPQTVSGTLASSVSVCAVANSGSLSLTGYTGNILNWQSSADNGASWNNITNTTNLINFSNLTATTLFRAAVQSGVCPAIYSNNVTVTVLQSVSTANAGPDQQLCNVSSASLAATIPSSGTGSWSALAGNPSTVTFTNPSANNTTVNGLTTGDYFFVWTVSNGLCADSKDTVKVSIDPQTVSGTLASSVSVCATANSGTLSITGTTGNILNWQSSTDNGASWTTISNTTSTINYNNLSTTTQYRANVQSGVCAALASNIVTITVLQPVTAANAGADQTLCNVTSATLSGNTPGSGTGTWSFVSGPSAVSFSNSADPAAVVNGLTTGTYQLAWTIVNGLCAASQDIVQITVNPQTVPGTLSASATVCATANSGTLSLTGTTGNILNWQSSTDNGASWTTISNTTSSLNYNNLSATTQYKATVQSGVCAALASNIVTITVLQPVTAANAGADQTLCNVTSATLSGNTPGSGTGTWSFVSGPSAVSFSNSADPAAVVNGLTTGTYQLAWTISNGLCAASQDIVQITVNPQTVPGTLSASATVCATANSGTLSLTGTTGNILNWQSSTDNGASWTTISNTTSTINYNNLSTTTQYRANVQSEVCSVLASNIVTITVLQPVTAANAGTDQTLCNVTSATLSGNTPGSGTGTWSFVSGPSAVSFSNSADPAAVVNGLTTGTYQLAWTISNGACSASQDIVQITVNPQTVPGTLSASATVCATANSGTLSLTGTTGNILNWQSSTDNGASWTTISNTTSTINYNNLSTTTQYRANVQSGVCAALASNIVSINVLQAVSTADAGADVIIINGITSKKLNGSVPTSGIGTWTQLSGPTTVSFSNKNDPKATVGGVDYIHGTPPTDGIYQLKWTVSNGVCAVSEDIMQITVQPPTNPGVIGPDAVVCTGNNHGTLVLTGYLGTILQWELSTDYGATWTVISSTVGTNQSTYDYNNLTTTTIFRALVQNGVGLPLYSGIAATITVLDQVTPANAGPDQAICNIATATLSGNTPSSGTGTWTQVSGPSTVTFSNVNDAHSTINGMISGTYQFAWTISNGICSDSRDDVQIIVYPPTNPGTLAAAATVCATANAGTLSLTGYISSILQWELSTNNGASWTTLSSTTDTYNYNNLSATTAYRALVQNAVCPALYSNTVTINVVQAVTTANAGPDQQLCNVTAATLAANTPASGTGTWSFVSGPSAVSFTNPADPNTTVNGLTTGTYQLAWTITNNLCAPSQDVMQITVYPPTNPGILAAAATVCATANAGTLSLTGYISSVLQWELSTNNGASWTTLSSTTDTYNYNNLAATTAYRALVQNAVCPALYSNTVTINVVQAVTTANAGPDQQLCNVTAATLAGNTPASGTGTWSFVSGPSAVSFTNPADPNTTVNGLTAGTYQFAWTITNNLCAPSQDVMQITVYPPTNPGTLAAAATVCATANAGTLSLTGYISSVLQWELSTNNGASWTTLSSTTDTYNYNNLAATTAYRALVQNAVCPALYSNTVTINVVQAVTTANAGPDQQLCNVTAATLAGNTPASGTGTWSFVSGPSAVSFTNPADPNTTVNGLTAGTYQFAWTITNNLCAPSQDVMQITVYPPTNPGTLAAAADVCATANSGTLLLTGFVSSVMHWEASTDNGASWSNIANTTSNYNYNNLTATTTYRALVQNAVCPALYSNNVTITVWQPVTTANAGPDQQLCNLTTATLAANTASSGTGKWTQIAGPTTVSFTNSADPNTTINGLTTGTYLFTWTISNNLCTDSKDTVQVTVYAPTVPGILAAAADVCANANSGTLLLTGFVSSVMHWEASTDNGASWSNIANTTANYNYNNLTATTTYRALVQNAVCPALYSNNVTITVWQPVTTANAGPDQQLCNLTTATLAANTASSGTGKWTQITGPTAVVFNNPADPATTVNGLTAGTYQFVWTISNNFCNDSKDTVQVTVFAPTVTGALVADAFVCVAGNDGIIKNTGATGNILRWEMSNDKDSNWVTVTNTNDSLSYHNLQKTTTYRVVVQNGNCPALTGNTVTVTVYQLSAGGNLTAHRDTVCATGNSGTLQLSNFTGTIQNWELSVDSGKNWKPISYTDTSYTYYGLNTTTWYRVLVRNGNCSDSYSDTAMVQVDQPTIAGTVTGATVLCSGNNSGMLLLSGRRGALLHWEFSTDNGNSWNLLAQTGDTLFYTGLTTTTQYRALVQNGSCAVEYTNTITLQVVPPVTPANAGEDQVICNNGNSITLNANTPVSGTGMWSMAEGPSKITFANPSQANTVVSGLITGTYYFVWTISNGICTGSSDTVVVKVDKLIASFSISSVNDCGKTTYFFNNNSQAAYGIRGYRWFNTTGDTLYKKDISLAYTTEGNHDMTLQVESNTGCYHSTQALYKVVVYEFPQANINAVADACKSQLFQVSSNINSKDSIAYILWNLGNGTKTKDSVISVKYMTDGKYTVQLTVATVNRCLDSAFKQIAIHPIPVVSINTKPVVCRGDSAILSANGAINYIWTDQDNRIICDGCITTKVKPAYNSTYKVIGYDQFGCSQLITTELRVVQPIKMLASSNDTICVGQSKQLFASGASSYIWTPETGLSNRTAASPMAKPQVTTTYQVIGRDRDNCFTDTAEIKIAVGNPTPINIGKDTVITAGSVYQLKARAERQDIRKWFWNGPGEFSCKNCQEPTVKLSNDADIYCIAVNAYGCVSNDTLSIKTFCASTDVFIPNAFSPDGDGVNDVLFVQGRGIKMVKSFRIFNRWGEVVFEKTNFLPGDPSYGWNGKIRGNPAPPDVFVYVCEVICEKGIPSIFKGNVAVLK